MFGWTIIRKERLKELEREEQIAQGLYFYYHWFSGWPNVHGLLEKFAHGKVFNSSVWSVRSDFAKTMGTDDWGKPTPSRGER